MNQTNQPSDEDHKHAADELSVPARETQAAKSFFSVPGNPEIPVLVRGYGEFIRLLNVVIIVLAALMLFGGMAGKAQGLTVVAIAQVIISSIMVWVGGALRDGKKRGVHALTILAVLELVGGLVLAASAKEGGVTIAIVVIVAVSIILGPPIVVAFKNWEKFKD